MLSAPAAKPGVGSKRGDEQTIKRNSKSHIFFGTHCSLAVINSVLPWFSSLVSLRFLFLDRFSLDRILGLKICIQVLHSSHLMSTPHRHKKPPTHSHNSLVHHHHGHPRPNLPPRPPAHPRIAPQTPSHPRPAVAEPS